MDTSESEKADVSHFLAATARKQEVKGTEMTTGIPFAICIHRTGLFFQPSHVSPLP